MNRPRLIALAAVLAASTSITSHAQTQRQRQPTPPREEKLVTLKFDGGTAADYAAAVKKAAGDVNIVVALESSEVPMPAVELTNASIESALNVLIGRSVVRSDRVVQLDVHHRFYEQEGEQPVYTIEAQVRSQRGLPDSAQISRVWSIADALKQGAKAADVLTAIQTSLDLLGDIYKPAQLKFHESTGLLIARGAPEQMDAISQVVNQITPATGSARTALKDLKDCAAEIERLKEKIATLEKELAAMKKNEQ